MLIKKYLSKKIGGVNLNNIKVYYCKNLCIKLSLFICFVFKNVLFILDVLLFIWFNS